MKAIISALSECKRGEPITSTRAYAQVPLINKELLLHQIETLENYAVTLLINEKNESVKEFLDENNIPFIEAELSTGVFTSGSLRRTCDVESAASEPGSLVVPGFLSFRQKQIDPSPKGEHATSLLTGGGQFVIDEFGKEKTLFVPGDIFPESIPEIEHSTLLTTASGSEEEEALRKVLDKNGIEYEERSIEALRTNYPWEMLTANTKLSEKITAHTDPSAIIEEGVTIKGPVTIGKNTIIKAGSYIEGPVIIGDDCIIGPMAHIRPETAIGDNCTFGKTELYDAIIMKGSVSKHQAYVAHSVLGEDVNVGAFSVTADYRHDAKEHIVIIHGEKIQSGRRKVGAFIGDHARLGISTSIYPGRKIWPNRTTIPGEILQKDKE